MNAIATLVDTVIAEFATSICGNACLDSYVRMSVGCTMGFTWLLICVSLGDGADAGVRMDFA